jgi:hypothetical protein
MTALASNRERFAAHVLRPSELRFTPIDTIHEAEHSQNPRSPLAGVPAECQECQKSFCGAAAVIEDPVFNVRTGRHHCQIWLYCNHGSHLAVFKAFCNRDASRIIAPAGEPTIVRDSKIVYAFLKAHPEARGVEM